MPTFLEDKPTDKDTLSIKGYGIHKKLSETLKNIIDNLSGNNSVKNIIGLFGDWGSGKSSIIEMIRKNNENYQVFEFDSWSHKDEFLKRAFLIELSKNTKTFLKEITEKDNFKKYENFEIGEVLNNNIKKQIIKNENKVKVNGLTIFLFIITLISLIGVNISDIFIKIFNFKNYISLGWIYNYLPYFILNNFKIIGFISIILFIVIIIYYYFKYYKKIIKYLEEELNKIFNYFVLKKIDFEENKVKSEGVDFTNFDYQELFKLIIKKYFENEKDKKLIIVLDNLDRVNDDIVLNSISLIQTTLEGIKEEKEENGENIFERLIFILPIDKDRLKKVFEKLIKNDSKDIEKNNFTEGFIDKTFSVIVDVPSLEQADWREYFRKQFEIAFKEEMKDINDKQLDELVSKFYAYVSNSGKKVTPREIINFINELVSNYLFWYNDIDILNQGEYILLKRYKLNNNNCKDENSWCKWIKENGKYEFNKFIVKQFYKTDDISDILYLDEIVDSLKEGNIKKFEENYNKIGISGNKEKLLENAYDKILKDENISIKIIGNMLNLVLENPDIKEIYKDKLQEFLNDEFGYNINFAKNIDKKSSEGILKLLEKYDEKEIKYIKNELPKYLIKAILSYNSQENE